VSSIRTPVCSAACNPDQGWTTGPWPVESMGDEPVPLTVRRFLADAGSAARAELPHRASSRDARDPLDLVTENVPVGARAIRLAPAG
jgi:hypothetical protein